MNVTGIVCPPEDGFVFSSPVSRRRGGRFYLSIAVFGVRPIWYGNVPVVGRGIDCDTVRG
jgi:hypothetical protein